MNELGSGFSPEEPTLLCSTLGSYTLILDPEHRTQLSEVRLLTYRTMSTSLYLVLFKPLKL